MPDPQPAFLTGLKACLAREPAFPLLRIYADAHIARVLTAAEVCTLAGRRATWLAARTQTGALVFIIAHDPLEQIVWWLAALMAQMVPGILTPPTAKLDRESYHRDLASILAAYPSALVLYGADVFADGQALDPRCVAIAGLTLPDAACDIADHSRGAEPLIFQQSSGTTGLRKGILISEAAAVAQLDSYGRVIGLRDDDVIVSWLPLYHDMGLVGCLMLAIYWQTPLVITSPFVWLSDAAWLFRAIQAHRGTLCWLPNFAFKYLADRVDPATLTPDALASLRLAINCSEPIHAAVMTQFAALYASAGLRHDALSCCYAMAENTFAVTQTPPGAAVRVETVDAQMLETAHRASPAATGRALVSSGTAVPNTQIRIRRDGHLCGDGDAGEIEVTSAFLMHGYVGIGDNAGLGSDGWFRTGDLGYLRDGHLFVIGRIKDVIIRAGRNIDPSYLEAALSGIDGLKPGRWVVFGLYNPKDGTEDVILLAETDTADTKPVKAAIVKACNVHTGIAPQRIELVPPNWLVKSSSGKISRTACRRKYEETFLAAR